MSDLKDLLHDALRQRITPGAAAAVVPLETDQGGDFFYVGCHNDEPSGQKVTPDTIYDLASLTKIMCTGMLVAQAVSKGELAFSDTPFPQWPKRQIGHLLAHNSGLPAWKPFYQRIQPEDTGLTAGKNALIQEVLDTPPEKECEEKTLYSDLGFIALGHLLEQTYAQELHKLYDEWLQKNIPQCQARFISLAESGFHPTYNQVAPTAECGWRGRRIQGQVHDDNSFCMGGVSGHAGLFGRLEDVVLFGRWLYENFQAHTPLGDTLRMMRQTNYERPLAFDLPTEGGSTGEALSPHAIGHLGFTGTSFWLDFGGPQHAPALYVLLTNRIYFKDSLEDIKKLRRHFHQKATTQPTQF